MAAVPSATLTLVTPVTVVPCVLAGTVSHSTSPTLTISRAPCLTPAKSHRAVTTGTLSESGTNRAPARSGGPRVVATYEGGGLEQLESAPPRKEVDTEEEAA